MSNPLVSVLLPVYNAEPYVDMAIVSILQQSLKDIELIALDDASNDGSSAIISRYSRADCRIKHIRSDENLGLSVQLNRGFELSRGQFIARMDADDIAMPTRFAEQIKVFESMPEVGVCGSIVETFTETGAGGLWALPETSAEIRSHQFFQCGFNHPSVMIRAEVLADFNLAYREDFVVAQDYELWCRLLKHTNGYNIQTPLLKYRRFAGQLSQAQSNRKNEELRQIRRTIREDLGLTPNPGDDRMHEIVANGNWPQQNHEFKEIVQWLNSVYLANTASLALPHDHFVRLLADRLLTQCRMSAKRGFNARAMYQNSDFALRRPMGAWDALITVMKQVLIKNS